MTEKRTSQRYRVFKGGTITFDGSGLACTVRNISDGGAAIDLEGPAALPQSFKLSITRDNFIRDCRAVWHHDKRVGVAFVP